MRPELKGGIAAISRAGRDKGRTYVVLCELDADFVMVCDGGSRPMDRPKKKRRKHLLSTRHEMQDFASRLEGKTLRDQEIRSFIERLNDPNPTDLA